MSQYRHVNMTVAIYVYENATLVLPPAVVDFRQRFDQAALDVPQACPATDLVSSQVKIWGRLIGDKAHLLVSKGESALFFQSVLQRTVAPRYSFKLSTMKPQVQILSYSVKSWAMLGNVLHSTLFQFTQLYQ